MEYGEIIAIFDIVVGLISLSVGLLLVRHFRRTKNKATLILSLYTIFYAIGCLLWLLEDLFLKGSMGVATAAYMLHYTPLYFGALFGALMLSSRPKKYFVISTIVLILGLLGFILFPLELVDTVEYVPSAQTRLFLLPLLVAGFLPALLFIAYGLKEWKDRTERLKGLSFGFSLLLVSLPEHILFPYGFIGLIPAWVIIVIGILFLYISCMSFCRERNL